MAMKKSPVKAPAAKSAAVPASPVVSTTPVRNSAVPPRAAASAPAAAKKSPPSYDQIARRAYEIWKSGKGGSQEENWFRAESELRSA